MYTMQTEAGRDGPPQHNRGGPMITRRGDETGRGEKECCYKCHDVGHIAVDSPRPDNKKECYKCLRFVDDDIASNCLQNLRGGTQERGGTRYSSYGKNHYNNHGGRGQKYDQELKRKKANDESDEGAKKSKWSDSERGRGRGSYRGGRKGGRGGRGNNYQSLQYSNGFQNNEDKSGMYISEIRVTSATVKNDMRDANDGTLARFS